MSPSSIGSRASTPTNYVAPRVPSILPAGSRQHSSTMHDNTPISMQSLRKLKDRRRAIANDVQVNLAEVPSTVNNQIELKLKAQQLDIARLREERDDLTKRLKKMEDCFERFSGVADRVEQEQKVSEALPHIVARLGALETFSLNFDVLGLQQNLGELKLKTDQLATIAVALPSLQEDVTLLRPILTRLDALGNVEGLMTNLRTHKNDIALALTQAAEAKSAVAKIPDLEGEITLLKHATEVQKTGIETLTTWKNAQPEAFSEQATRKLVMEEVVDKTAAAKEVLRRAIATAEEKLGKRISAGEESLKKTDKNLDEITKRVRGLQQAVDTIPPQLNDLYTKAKDLEVNSSMTYKKASRVETDLNDFKDSRKSFERFEKDMDRYMDDIEKFNEYRRDLKKIIPNLQKSAKELQELDEAIFKYIGPIEKDYNQTKKTVLGRLANVQGSIGLVDIGKIVTRMEELERLNRGPAFGKAGTAVTSSPTLNSPVSPLPTPGVSPSRVDQLAKDLQNLEGVVQGDSGFKLAFAHNDQRLADIEQTLQNLNASNGPIAALQGRLAQLDRRLNSSPTIANQPGNKYEATSSSFVDLLGQQISVVQSDLEGLFASLEKVGDRVHEHDGAITIVRDVVPGLFEKHFDPFKSMVETELSAINQKLATYAQVQQCSFDGEQQSQLRALAATTAGFRNDMSTLQSENQNRIAELARKADTVDVRRQIDAIVVAVRDLETRYQNITTDEQYQRMAHWFAHMYPTSAALIQDAAQARQDINQLMTFHNQVARILSSSNDLRYLCQNTAQLQSLVDRASHLQHLANNVSQLQALVQQGCPQTLAKVDQAYTDVQTAITQAGRAVAKVDEHIRTNEKATSLSQASIQQLTSADSPLAKAEALRALENTIQTLQTDLRTQEVERSTKLQELRKIFGDEHDQRVKIEKRIMDHLNHFKPWISEVVKQVDEVKTAAYEHRSEFNEINNTLIQPNRDFFGLFGTVLTVLAQLQQVVENMNQNLPVAPLRVEWECYLPALGQQAEMNGETGIGKGKGKDKGKQ
ncbi:hypothetical protein DDE82_008772 [Stemphylium lycopersici]|nr:hypothetical protein DDE82_008772 [Stemphylium lycopersici]